MLPPRLALAACLLAAGLAPAARAAPAACDSGLILPEGFCATVFADGLGVARHLVVDAEGRVYVALQQRERGGGIVMLQDKDGDGRADEVRRFGDSGGTGIALAGSWLYFATETAVLRYPMKDGLPAGAPQTVVGGFPQQDEHAAKSIALDGAGHLYVNVGAPSNACQQDDRVPGSPGLRPCPLLAEHGGVWRFDAGKLGQKFPGDGERYASGIRNAVALGWSGADRQLYALQMGRDQLSYDWPRLFSDADNAELPGEEFLALHAGDDFGWPYCYYDQRRGERVQAPEYGGDGKQTADCGKYAKPLLAFPGHWAPEAVLFYSGGGFPAQYRGGAFVSFHGSWNRAPLPQAGFKVVYVPFKDGKPAGPYQVFADGFAGKDAPRSQSDAAYRPMGLALGPDGALYIGDTQHGRIWRVTYSPAH